MNRTIVKKNYHYPVKFWAQWLKPETIEELNEFKEFLKARTFDGMFQRMMKDEYLLIKIRNMHPEIIKEIEV